MQRSLRYPDISGYIRIRARPDRDNRDPIPGPKIPWALRAQRPLRHRPCALARSKNQPCKKALQQKSEYWGGPGNSATIF